VPELRIVPQELWEVAKARQREMARETRPDAKRKDFWELQRPRYLLSSLMKCGCCGASYTKYGLNRFGCAATRDRATCTNPLEKTEREIRRLIEAIKAGVLGAAVKDEMTILEAKRVELLARFEAAPPPMPRLHPNLAELYRQKVMNLAQALNDEHMRLEAAECIVSSSKRSGSYRTMESSGWSYMVSLQPLSISQTRTPAPRERGCK